MNLGNLHRGEGGGENDKRTLCRTSSRWGTGLKFWFVRRNVLRQWYEFRANFCFFFFFKDYNKSNLSLSVSTFFFLCYWMIGQESVWCIVYIQGPYFFFKDYNKSNLSLSVSTFFFFFVTEWLVKGAFDVLSIYRALLFFFLTFMVCHFLQLLNHTCRLSDE